MNKSNIHAAQSKLQELEARHAAALQDAQTTLNEAAQAKREAYELLLRARASGAANISELHAAHEKATTALQAAQLEADTSCTVAAMLEPQIEAGKDELARAQTEHAAARIKALRDSHRVEIERCNKLREEIDDSNIKALVIQNRLAALLRRDDGFYAITERPIVYDRETLLTKGALIARFEAEINAIGE